MKRDTNDDLTYDPNYKGERKIAEDGTGTLLWIESVIPNETVIMHCRSKLEPIKHQARFGFTVKGYRGQCRLERYSVQNHFTVSSIAEFSQL